MDFLEVEKPKMSEILALQAHKRPQNKETAHLGASSRKKNLLCPVKNHETKSLLESTQGFDE